MSRLIDAIPEPLGTRKMKIVIPSASRTGTLGLYTAMQMLGFAPYHMKELVLRGGIRHMKLLIESMRAEYDRFSGIKRYSRKDFAKWFSDYDCLIEIPFYMGSEAIEAYVQDPDVRFIMTERDPDKWVTSVNRTVGEIVEIAQRPHIRVLAYFDSDLSTFLLLNQLVYMRIALDTHPNMPDNRAVMKKNYISYIDMLKRTIPKDRMCCIRLEDGLDWEQICPFLGVSPPKEAFPRGNKPEEFQELVGAFIQARAKHAALKLGFVLVASASAIFLGFRSWNTILAVGQQATKSMLRM